MAGKYKADGFFPQSGARALRGHIEPSSSGLLWIHEETTKALSWNDCTLSWGGGSTSQIVVTLSSDENTQFYIYEGKAFLNTVREIMPRTTSSPGPDELLQEKLKRETSSIAVHIAILASIIVIIFFAIKATAIVESYVVNHIPCSVDRALGTFAGTEFFSGNVIDDTQANKMLSETSLLLIDTLVCNDPSQADRQYEFLITENSAVNAFAVPGGKIYITTGLIEFAASHDELAGVIAHEIIHQQKRHAIARVVNLLKWQLLISVFSGDLTGIEELIIANGKYLLQAGYSREQEWEADVEGMKLMMKAGYDPTAVPRFFSRLAEKEHFLSENFDFLSDHPSSEKRARQLERIIRSENLSSISGKRKTHRKIMLESSDKDDLHQKDHQWASFQAMVKSCQRTNEAIEK